MFEHFKGNEPFVKKVIDLKNQAVDYSKIVTTKFLNPYEQSIVKNIVGNAADVYEYGGFIGAENQRMIICPSFYEIEPSDFEIVIVQVDYNNQFGELKHKDVLGALMNLGIKRELIGDIYDRDGLYFACVKEQYEYIRMHLTKIKRSTIHLSIVDESIEIVHEYRTKTFFVSSLRIDRVLSTLYGVPRSKTMEYIHGGMVKVNHKVVEETSFLCNNNDIISFSKHGRVKLVVTERVSKQGHKLIEGMFYK